MALEKSIKEDLSPVGTWIFKYKALLEQWAPKKKENARQTHVVSPAEHQMNKMQDLHLLKSKKGNKISITLKASFYPVLTRCIIKHLLPALLISVAPKFPLPSLQMKIVNSRLV